MTRGQFCSVDADEGDERRSRRVRRAAQIASNAGASKNHVGEPTAATTTPADLEDVIKRHADVLNGRSASTDGNHSRSNRAFGGSRRLCRELFATFARLQEQDIQETQSVRGLSR